MFFSVYSIAKQIELSDVQISIYYLNHAKQVEAIKKQKAKHAWLACNVNHLSKSRNLPKSI
jgi:hypothetical protein